MAAFPGQGWSKPVFQLGRNKTLAVSFELHEINRKKLVDILHARGVEKGIVLIKGGDEACRYDTDREELFIQDSWFQYLFGVKEPGFLGCIDIATSKSILFMPRLPEEYAIWCGKIHTPEYFKTHYAVNEVVYVDELSNYLLSLTYDEHTKIHQLEGTNSDSGTYLKPFHIDGVELLYKENRFDSTILYHALSTSRVTKTDHEIEVLRYSNYVASNAHVEVMKFAKAGLHEYEFEAKFLYEIYSKGGCRNAAYVSICGCGPNGATLHYGHAGAPNDREAGVADMALLDMGATYHGYDSDITCSYPISGKFTEDQKAIFEAVLNAQRAVVEAAKPGVSWAHCHNLAQLEIVKKLIEIGILINGTPEELVNKGLGAVFFPHGLGHLIGLDTHDVGGYISGTPARSTLPGISKLRTSRLLEERMILTNEPGCYFIEALLTAAEKDPVKSVHIDFKVLDRFRNFGGVRLEDDILITSNGVENLTLCPRTVDEIESVMAGGQWPPAKDQAPYLRRRWTKLGVNGSMENVDIPSI